GRAVPYRRLAQVGKGMVDDGVVHAAKGPVSYLQPEDVVAAVLRDQGQPRKGLERIFVVGDGLFPPEAVRKEPFLQMVQHGHFTEEDLVDQLSVPCNKARRGQARVVPYLPIDE